MVEHSRVERAIREVGSLTGHGAQLGDDRQTSPEWKKKNANPRLKTTVKENDTLEVQLWHPINKFYC